MNVILLHKSLKGRVGKRFNNEMVKGPWEEDQGGLAQTSVGAPGSREKVKTTLFQVFILFTGGDTLWSARMRGDRFEMGVGRRVVASRGPFLTKGAKPGGIWNEPEEVVDVVIGGRNRS